MYNIPLPRFAGVAFGCAILLLPDAGGEGRLDAQPVRPDPAPTFAPALLPIRTQLPAGWKVRSLDGATRSIADWEGRVVVLNLWASWCRPCVRELESFRALAAALREEGMGDDDVSIVLLTPERPAAVTGFVHRRLRDMPVYLEHDPLPVELGMRAVPTTWILDRSGRVVVAHRGAADWHGSPVRALLHALVDERGDHDSSARVRPRNLQESREVEG